MVDMGIAGHLTGSDAAVLIGGITIGSMLFDLLYWSFGFLRTGTGGLTAQAYGKALVLAGGNSDSCPVRSSGAIPPTSWAPPSNTAEGGPAVRSHCSPGETSPFTECGSILRRALRIALVSAVAMIALQWAILRLAFLFVDCSPAVEELASRYFRIRIWAAPATLSLFALKGWFIGMQNTRAPMAADLTVNFVNIGASLLLAVALGIGFDGVAWGTVIAQWTGLVLSLAIVYFKYGPALRHPAHGEVSSSVPDSSAPSFFRMNVDLFLRSLGMIAVYIGFTVISARYGDMMLAVSAVLMKLLMFFSYFTDGFAFAAEALTGRFIGENDRPMLQSSVRCNFLWSGALAVLFIGIYALAGLPAFRLLTSDAAVVGAAREFLPWLLLMPIVGCPAFVWDGVYIGATASRDLRNSTLLCAVGFFAVYFIGIALAGAGVGTGVGTGVGAGVSAVGISNTMGIHILMGAYFTHLLIRSVYLTARYRATILGTPREA